MPKIVEPAAPRCRQVGLVRSSRISSSAMVSLGPGRGVRGHHHLALRRKQGRGSGVSRRLRIVTRQSTSPARAITDSGHAAVCRPMIELGSSGSVYTRVVCAVSVTGSIRADSHLNCHDSPSIFSHHVVISDYHVVISDYIMLRASVVSEIYRPAHLL